MWDRWNPQDRRGDIATDAGFRALRKPEAAALAPIVARHPFAVVAPVEDGSVPLAPGERIIDGRRVYSARWL